MTRAGSRPEKTVPRLALGVSEASALPRSLAALAYEDLPGAIDSAKSLPRGERAAAVEAVLRAALAHHPEFVSRELATSGLPYSTRGEISVDLVKIWPDANKALAWADKNLTGVNRGAAISAALARVVAKSPPDAIAFIETMPAGSTRDDAMRDTIRSWANADLQAAIRYAETGAGNPVVRNEAEWLYGRWAQTDPASAEAFLRQAADDTLLGMMAALLAVGHARSDGPAAAMTWALDLSGKSGERARKAAISEWSKTDPEAAAAFIDQSDPTLQSQLVPILTAEWKQRDPAAAANWTNSR